MAKRFEKKNTDKKEIKKEENKVVIGKAIVLVKQSFIINVIAQGSEQKRRLAEILRLDIVFQFRSQLLMNRICSVWHQIVPPLNSYPSSDSTFFTASKTSVESFLLKLHGSDVDISGQL